VSENFFRRSFRHIGRWSEREAKKREGERVGRRGGSLTRHLFIFLLHIDLILKKMRPSRWIPLIVSGRSETIRLSKRKRAENGREREGGKS